MPSYRGTPIDLLVDVRSRLEFFLGHLDGAVCIPHDRLPDTLSDHDGISTKSRIVLYCASGARSAAAAQALRAAGYSKVTDAGPMSEARHDIS
jgi:phage shock protein E